MSGVSVVICAYGRPHETLCAVTCALDQTLPPDEVIVVDDCSTPPIVLPKHPKLRVIRHPENKGAAGARNTGIRQARNALIALLDTDDLWHRHKLERQVPLLAEAPDKFGGCFTAYFRQESDSSLRNGVITTPNVRDWYRFFALGLRAGPGTTMLVRRAVFDDIGYYDEDMRRHEDWDWLLRAAEKYRFVATADVLGEIFFSGRPDPDSVTRGLNHISGKHLGGLWNPFYKRHLRAGLAFERAAVAKHRGDALGLLTHLIATGLAPELLYRELRFTFNSRQRQTNSVKADLRAQPVTWIDIERVFGPDEIKSIGLLPTSEHTQE